MTEGKGAAACDHTACTRWYFKPASGSELDEAAGVGVAPDGGKGAEVGAGWGWKGVRHVGGRLKCVTFHSPQRSKTERLTFFLQVVYYYFFVCPLAFSVLFLFSVHPSLACCLLNLLDFNSVSLRKVPAVYFPSHAIATRPEPYLWLVSGVLFLAEAQSG